MYIVEMLTPSYDLAWLPWAVLYFFFVGVSINSAWMTGVLTFARTESQWRLLQPSVIATLLISSIIAPIALLADLHQPGRFWHFYAHPTIWSWMSVGAFLLPVYLGVVFLSAYAWWMGKEKLLRWLAIPLMLMALSIALYTGVEVMVVKSRALWYTPFLPFNFLVTGWIAALGMMLLLNFFLPHSISQRFPIQLFKDIAKWAWAITFIVASSWILHGLAFRSDSLMSAWNLLLEYPVWRISLVFSVICCIWILYLVYREKVLSCSETVVLALLMMASGWIFRWVIFMQVQGVPKYGAGLYLYEIPWGSGGWLGMLGMLGLAVCLIALLQIAYQCYPAKYLQQKH